MMWFRYGWVFIWIIMGVIVLPLWGAVVINEIMYNPADAQGDDSYFEYIELVNTGSAVVDLSGWSFTAGTFFTFSPGVTLGPGQYLTVCANQDSIRSYYGITNTVGNFGNRLNNAGETIRLVNEGSGTEDEVTYLDISPWVTEPDGNGPSLELIHYNLDNSVAGNWAASAGYGTPGLVNSAFVPEDSTEYFTLFFTQIVHTSYATEAVAQGMISLSNKLVELINTANSTLDLCIYSFSDAVISSAVIGAHNRGVRVRVIVEHDNRNSLTTALESAGITVIDDTFGANGGSGLMHNKFVVVDYQGASDNANTVWTGSFNWTLASNTIDANNGITIRDEGLSGAYTAEFNEMWGSSGAIPNSTTSRFGTRKTDNITHTFTVDEHQIGVYMSPSDGLDTAIENAIATADHEIAFCILAFTHTDIMLAMKTKWDDDLNYPDFQVEGVFDSQNAASSYSQWWNMSGIGSTTPWSPPADVWRDSLLPAGALLHHKYMVIDGNHPYSDPIVITGSMNWSNNGVENNDENIVIIHDTKLANLYLQEFYARKSQAMGNLPPIYDVQYPQPSGEASPYAGKIVTITGVVTAGFPDATHRTYMVQGPISAPWWGIYVYQTGTGSNFVVGDSISVRGTVEEYYGLTEITGPSYTHHGSAMIVPDPLSVSTADVSTKESLESLLVQVENVTVVSGMNGYGEWQVDDGSGVCWVDDMGTYSYIPNVGDTISQLRGVIYHGFDSFKLEPRDDNDFVFSYPRVDSLTIQRLGNHITLQWEALAGASLYRIYADILPDFDPSPANQIASTTDTQWLEVNALVGSTNVKYYRVVADY